MPSPLLVLVCFWPVASFVNVSVAPGTTAPLWSVTTPCIDPRYWAKARGEASTSNSPKRSDTGITGFREEILQRRLAGTPRGCSIGILLFYRLIACHELLLAAPEPA